jgi:aspartyl-tRNA(Asn)/glutamyl-tRNA(Gln) amidotransferase subunit B
MQVGQGDKAYEKVVRLTRAHLEEDAGKSLHEDFHGKSGIDLNRAGTPLLEIVTEPDMRSSAEAVAYAKALHALVRWIGICDGNMQEGSFRCDANVSVRPRGQAEFGTRREIKNLNSFRFLQAGHRLRGAVADQRDRGRRPQDPAGHRAVRPRQRRDPAMRSKEDAHDYRYFPDPDLLPLVIDRPTGSPASQAGCLNCRARSASASSRLGLSAYDASALTASPGNGRLFRGDRAERRQGQRQACANWVMVDLAARLNKEGKDIAESPVSAAQLAGLVARIADNTISNNIAKKVFEALWNGEGATADEDHRQARA